MMRSILFVLLAATAPLAPLEGCFSVDNRLTLMPDGSGKIDLSLSAKVDKQDPTDLLAFGKYIEGIVALTPAVDEFKDGWKYSRFTAYFEDINKVRSSACEGTKHEDCIHFSVQRTATGSTLVMEDWHFDTMEGATLLRWKVAMPGKVTKVEGFQRMVGREAVIELGPKTGATKEEAAKWPPAARRRIECGANEVAEKDQTAFKKELSDAKAAWAKLKAELEAKKVPSAK